MTALGIAQGFGGFLLYLAAMTVLLHICRRAGPAPLAMVVAFVAGIAACALILLLGHTLNFWEYAVSYWFFALSFLMVFGAVYKSISLRILLDLSNKPGRTDFYDRILDRYVAAESFEKRLAVITKSHLAIPDGNHRLSLTRRGLRISHAVGAVQRLYRVARSG